MTSTTPMTRTAIFHARVAEAIYVALSGTDRITVDDDPFELPPLGGERVADRRRA